MSDNIKVQAVPFDQLTNWEVILIEEEIGLDLAKLGDFFSSDKPKRRFYTALMWVALRRKMGDSLTLQKVAEGPYELDVEHLVTMVTESGGGEDDPKDEEETAPEKPGEQSLTQT